MNNWTIKEYVAAILATIVTFLILKALFRWIKGMITGGGGGGGTGNAAGGGNTNVTLNTNINWVDLAKGVSLVIGACVLACFLIGLYSPIKEGLTKLIAKWTPSFPDVNWDKLDFKDPKFWIMALAYLIGALIIIKIIQALGSAFARHTPAQSNPVNWPEIWKGVIALTIIGCIIYFLYPFREPTVKMYSKLIESSSSSSDRNSSSASNSEPEDSQIMKMNQYERERDITLLQKNLEYVWHIPMTESTKILSKSNRIPGALFWRNMEKVYQFKRLPNWRWNNLPSSVVPVPENYTYVLPIMVSKYKSSRKIPVRGWNDWIHPSNPIINGSYFQICDSGSPSSVTVYFSDKTKRYYVYQADGKIVLQPEGWCPHTVNHYELRLPPDHESNDSVEFLITRQRHSVSVYDPEPPETRTE